MCLDVFWSRRLGNLTENPLGVNFCRSTAATFPLAYRSSRPAVIGHPLPAIAERISGIKGHIQRASKISEHAPAYVLVNATQPNPAIFRLVPCVERFAALFPLALSVGTASEISGHQHM
jgi:hypothetical protein